MSPEQAQILGAAGKSVQAARLLHDQGFHGFAASRAYYAMFYVAEALLEGEGLSFSKHSAVIAAFGERFVKTGRLPAEFHRFLLEALRLRHEGDYSHGDTVTAVEAAEQITRAERFLALVEGILTGTEPSFGSR